MTAAGSTEATAVPAGRVFLVSVGSSVFQPRNIELHPDGRSFLEVLRGLRDEGRLGSLEDVLERPGEEQRDLEALLQPRLVARTAASLPVSAELTTLLSLSPPPGAPDEVHWIATATESGLVAARVLDRFAREQLGTASRVQPIRDLQVADPERLERSGLPELIKTTAQILWDAGDRPTVLVSTGSYKPVSTYLTIAGLLFGARIVYVYSDELEGQAPAVLIQHPPMKLTPDVDLWQRNQWLFEQVDRKGPAREDLMLGRVHDWEDALAPYFTRSGGEIGFSAMGRLLHEAAKRFLIDPITGLVSGQDLNVVQLRLGRLSRFACLYFDVDRFKEINAAHKHGGGDAVLRAIAERARDVLEGRGEVFRHGGDEFLAVLPDADAGAAAETAAKLLEAVASRPVLYDGREVRMSITIGIATCPEDAARVEDVIRAADERLVDGKELGRGRAYGLRKPPRSVR